MSLPWIELRENYYTVVVAGAVLFAGGAIGGASAQSLPTYDVSLVQDAVMKGCPAPTGCAGAMDWRYTVSNTGSATIVQGTRLTVRIDVPGRLKVVDLAQLPGTGTIKTAANWYCDAPYAQMSGVNGVARTPDTVKCHFVSDVDIATGQSLPTLRSVTDGGYPAMLCARANSFTNVGGSWKLNPDPLKGQISNAKCFAYAGKGDYDLDLHTGYSGNVSSQVWQVHIQNVGDTAIKGPGKWSGFYYEARIPPGAKLQELVIPRGWQCKVIEDSGKIVGPFPAFPANGVPLNGPNPAPFYPMAPPYGLKADGSRLDCDYLTRFEFGAYAKLSPSLYQTPVSYWTTDWPASKHPASCSNVSEMFDNPLEKNQTNNRHCVSISTGNTTQCPATCDPLW